MDFGVLKKIGLTDGEIRVYFSLLDLGESTTGDIIKKSMITSSKVYLILDRLQQKGLVSHIVKNNVMHFKVADPKMLINYMDDKRRQFDQEYDSIKELIPILSKRRKEISSKQETMMYLGEKGIKTSLYDFIEGLSIGDEFLVLGTNIEIGKNERLIVRQFYLRKAELKIKTRLIYNSSQRKIKSLYNKVPLTQVRFIDNITPSTIVISQRKVLLITYGSEARAVLIESKQIAESFKQFFESMWQIAKK